MSLVAVYDALRAAGADEAKATAAVEALEANRDQERLQRMELQMEKRFARLEWMGRANMILTTVCLALITGILLRMILG